jgi:hypothetical protein
MPEFCDGSAEIISYHIQSMIQKLFVINDISRDAITFCVAAVKISIAHIKKK